MSSTSEKAAEDVDGATIDAGAAAASEGESVAAVAAAAETAAVEAGAPAGE